MATERYFNLESKKLLNDLENLVKQVAKSANLSLSKDSSSSLSCLPSYVYEAFVRKVVEYRRDNGHQENKDNLFVLTLDFSSDTLNMAIVDIPKQISSTTLLDRIISKEKVVFRKEEKQYQDCEKFFNFIGNKCYDFLEGNISKLKIDEGCPKIPVIFTFPFKCENDGLKKSLISGMSKNFEVVSCIGKDSVEMLNRSFQINMRPNLPGFEVSGIINDSVSSLFSLMFCYPNITMAMRLNVGCNLSMLIDTKNLISSSILSREENVDENGRVIVNTELGNFGHNDSLEDFDALKIFFNEFDEKDSKNVKNFEFLVGGLYIMENFRKYLIKMHTNLVARNAWLLNEFSFKFETFKNALSYLGITDDSMIGNDKCFLRELIPKEFSEVKSYIKCLLIRSAALVSAAIVGFALNLNTSKEENNVEVGLVGEFTETIIEYRQMVNHFTKELFNSVTDGSKTLSIVSLQDSSLYGSALLGLYLQQF